MQELLQLMIKKNGVGYGPSLNEDDFLKLYELAVHSGIAPSTDCPLQERSFFNISCPPEHPGVEVLLSFLEERGWQLYPGYVPKALRKTHYHYTLRRFYSDEELACIPYFCVFRWGESFTELIDPVARPRLAMAEIVDWEVLHGWAYGDGNLYVQTVVKERLDMEFEGVFFHPLEWDHPEMARAGYWALDTARVMPACLLPVVDMDDMWMFEEGFYHPPHLAFKRHEVESMGPFDVAWTREVLSKRCPKHKFRLLIVSQKFRRICLELGLSSQLTPVSLVG